MLFAGPFHPKQRRSQQRCDRRKRQNQKRVGCCGALQGEVDHDVEGRDARGADYSRSLTQEQHGRDRRQQRSRAAREGVDDGEIAYAVAALQGFEVEDVERAGGAERAGRRRVAWQTGV